MSRRFFFLQSTESNSHEFDLEGKIRKATTISCRDPKVLFFFLHSDSRVFFFLLRFRFARSSRVAFKSSANIQDCHSSAIESSRFVSLKLISNDTKRHEICDNWKRTKAITISFWNLNSLAMWQEKLETFLQISFSADFARGKLNFF